jgi:hypothetical protein
MQSFEETTYILRGVNPFPVSLHEMPDERMQIIGSIISEMGMYEQEQIDKAEKN